MWLSILVPWIIHLETMSLILWFHTQILLYRCIFLEKDMKSRDFIQSIFLSFFWKIVWSYQFELINHCIARFLKIFATMLFMLSVRIQWWFTLQCALNCCEKAWKAWKSRKAKKAKSAKILRKRGVIAKTSCLICDKKPKT